MSKVYTTAVVIIPPKKKWDSLQEIRKKYDRQIDRWMPHITLMYPFRPINQFITLKKKFLERCIHINSFEVTLNDFRYFKHRNNNFTLWLNPIPNDLIIHLQSEILKILPDCNDINKHKNGFQPHLSVGQIQGIKRLKEALYKLKKSWKELKFVLESIYFISREKDKASKFRIIKEIPLKK